MVPPMHWPPRAPASCPGCSRPPRANHWAGLVCPVSGPRLRRFPGLADLPGFRSGGQSLASPEGNASHLRQMTSGAAGHIILRKGRAERAHSKIHLWLSPRRRRESQNPGARGQAPFQPLHALIQSFLSQSAPGQPPSFSRNSAFGSSSAPALLRLHSPQVLPTGTDSRGPHHPNPGSQTRKSFPRIPTAVLPSFLLLFPNPPVRPSRPPSRPSPWPPDSLTFPSVPPASGLADPPVRPPGLRTRRPSCPSPRPPSRPSPGLRTRRPSRPSPGLLPVRPPGLRTRRPSRPSPGLLPVRPPASGLTDPPVRPPASGLADPPVRPPRPPSRPSPGLRTRRPSHLSLNNPSLNLPPSQTHW
ncbi:mucin-1-like [Antechinus flavipes]|uniref:mucin-1-like n=1 Tax=Antechinus flavipes TaxID=38775 RepID=UPI002236B16F|nr:mucin-1-like [Antechinus flavipes]